MCSVDPAQFQSFSRVVFEQADIRAPCSIGQKNLNTDLYRAWLPVRLQHKADMNVSNAIRTACTRQGGHGQHRPHQGSWAGPRLRVGAVSGYGCRVPASRSRLLMAIATIASSLYTRTATLDVLIGFIERVENSAIDSRRKVCDWTTTQVRLGKTVKEPTLADRQPKNA